jgi:protein-S-isoprenylcysteine O-methyltransferase Ste14
MGISLVFRSWLTLIFVMTMTLVPLWRIHDEETLMREEFGTDGESYS